MPTRFNLKSTHSLQSEAVASHSLFFHLAGCPSKAKILLVKSTRKNALSGCICPLFNDGFFTQLSTPLGIE